MILHAINLENVGCFSRPMTVAGLSPGLNVLAGSNELGKSTVLKALRAAFFEGERSVAQRVKALMPYAGGTPTVAVVFDVNNRRYRLEKVFHRSRGRALLWDETANREVAQNADVAPALGELVFGDDGAAWLALLWAGQKDVLTELDLTAKPYEGARVALQTLAEGEVGALVGTGAARQVRKAVAAFLAEHVTERTGRAKKGGPLALAELTHADLCRQASEAETRARTAAASLDELQALALERRVLIDPTQRAVLEARLAQSQVELAEVEQHAARVADARLKAELAARELADGRTRLQTLEERLARLATLTADTEAGRAALERAQFDRDELTKRQDDARDARSADAERLAAIEALLESWRLHDDQVTKRRDFEALEARCISAREASTALATATWPADRPRILDAEFSRASELNDEITQLRATLHATAPQISLALEQHAVARVKIDGQAVDASMDLRAPAPTTIAIEGIGEITISPGAMAIDDPREALTAAEAALSSILRRHAVDDLTALGALARRQREAIASSEQHAARLQELAPDGLELLEEARDDLRAQLQNHPSPPDTLPDLSRAQLLDERHTLVDAQLPRQQALDAIAQELQGAVALFERLTERLQRVEAEANELERVLPREDDRRELLENGRSEVAQRARALDAATALERAAFVHAPTVEHRQAIERAIAEAEGALRDRAARLHAIDVQMAGLEAGLDRDRADDIESEAARLREASNRSGEQLARVKAEVSAHQLLAATLEEAEAQQKLRIEAPILDRLSPYAAEMFPGAALGFDANLNLETLERGDAREALVSLSDGTREQVAVLSRLGLARARADLSGPLPLILDDALVYSDDERMASAFSALRLASQHHQVIVLTCRAAQFEALGGSSLALVPASTAKRDSAAA